MWGAVSEGSWGYWDTVIVDHTGYRGGRARQCTLGKGVYAHAWPRVSVLQGQGWTSFYCPGKHFSPPRCLQLISFWVMPQLLLGLHLCTHWHHWGIIEEGGGSDDANTPFQLSLVWVCYVQECRRGDFRCPEAGP